MQTVSHNRSGLLFLKHEMPDHLVSFSTKGSMIRSTDSGTRGKTNKRQSITAEVTKGYKERINAILLNPLLATRVPAASPEFGREKHGQKWLQPNFCQHGVCCTLCNNHFIRKIHHNISFCFRVVAQRVKKFCFFSSRILCVTLFLD